MGAAVVFSGHSPQTAVEVDQRARLEGTMQKLSLALTFPFTSDTGRCSSGKDFQILWKAWSAPALGPGSAWWDPC